MNENVDVNVKDITFDASYDWIVVGGGAAGMTSALTANHLGLKTLIVEKTPYIGGSTARSAGCVWVPNNHLLHQAGAVDTPEQATTYFSQTVGSSSPLPLQQAYIKNASVMIKFLSQISSVRFQVSTGYPDYYAELPGGMTSGRCLEPVPIDANLLGENKKYLRPPVLPYAKYTGLNASNAAPVLLFRHHASGRWALLKFLFNAAKDFLLGRVILTMGQGVAGHLYHAILKAGIKVETKTSLGGFIIDQGKIVGVIVYKNYKPYYYQAKKGVMLAAGGFAKNQAMRDQYLPYPSRKEWSIAAEGDTGDAITAGERIGAKLNLMDDAWWGPVSHTQGTDAPNFNVVERSKPGSIMVNGQGQRFVNESAPYCDVVNKIYELHQKSTNSLIPCWIILDKNNRNSYSLGVTPPAAPISSKHFENGDIVKADSLEALATKLNIPTDNLLATVKKFNQYAIEGEDKDFQRGETAYDQFFGDSHFKNHSLAPLTKAPYYAIRLFPGDISTRGGLVTNEFAQVQNYEGKTIEGLYAAGNTMATVMGHSYPGPGATIGPAMTFGYLGAQHAAITENQDPSSKVSKHLEDTEHLEDSENKNSELVPKFMEIEND